MSSDDTGDWGQPKFLDGGAMDAAGDPNDLSEYFAPMVPRVFSTYADLLAATPPNTGYLARALDVPGVWFEYIGSSWVMAGEARLDSSTTIVTLLTAATRGDLALAEDIGSEWRYDGSAWKLWTVPETSFTPSITNLTLGSGGTSVGWYAVVDGLLFFEVIVVLGSGGTWNSSVLTVPGGLSLASGNVVTIGETSIVDTSTSTRWPGKGLVTAATTIRFEYQTGTPVASSPVTNSAPISSLAAGDILLMSVSGARLA